MRYTCRKLCTDLLCAFKYRTWTSKVKPYKNAACFDNCIDRHADVSVLIVPSAFHLLLSPKKTHAQIPILQQVSGCHCLSAEAARKAPHQ